MNNALVLSVVDLMSNVSDVQCLRDQKSDVNMYFIYVSLS